MLLWVGDAVSTVGSQVSLVAFPLLILTTTHSAAKAGFVGFANQVPVLAFYLPAGVLVDRCGRRAIMVISSLIGGLALASMPVALALGSLPFLQVLIVAFLAGARQVVYSVAEQGALPLVVSAEQVSQAVVGNQARTEAAYLAGPPLGGVLFGVARSVPFAVDSASYLFAAVAARLVTTPLQEPRALPSRRAAAEIAEGVRWLWSQPFLRASAFAVAAANLTVVALELVLIVRARQGGASSAAVGTMLALIGFGGLLGSALAMQIARRIRSQVIVIGLFWIETLLLLPLLFTHNPYLLGMIVGAATILTPAWNAIVVGTRLKLTPDHLRGRVISAARLISGSLLALGPLVAGFLSQTVGTTRTLLVLAVWQLFVALVATATKPLRTGIAPTPNC
jgi:MFS family permease